MKSINKALLVPLLTLLLALIATMCSAGNYDKAVFLHSSHNPFYLDLTLANGNTYSYSTADHLIQDGFMQGWWSPDIANVEYNDNVAIENIEYNYQSYWNTRDFFTFDLSNLSSEVTAAKLRGNSYMVLGAPVTVDFYDVSTDYAVLNKNEGTSPAIYNDLGSGKLYSSHIFKTSYVAESIDLNANAIADINNARGGYFSIGGTLPVPETSTFLTFGSLLISGSLLLRRRVSKK